jgi:hypothetical protein
MSSLFASSSGTEVGPIGVEGRVTDFSFRNADGTPFAYDAFGPDHRLILIEKATGAARRVGSTGIWRRADNGIAFDSSDTLFHSTMEFDNGCVICPGWTGRC